MRLLIAAVIAGCLLVGGCGNSEDDAGGKTAQATQKADVAAAAASAALAEYARPFPHWTYGNFMDAMAGKPVYTATLSSNETIDLQPPYAGPQSATLVLRMHPDGNADILFVIRRGQLVCNEGIDNGCPISIRLGDSKQQIAYGNGPTDHSQNAVFLRGPGLNLAAIAAAGVFRIQMPIFDNGSQVFTFDVAGLDLSKLKAAGT